jgi:hypothetical protein
MKTLIGFASKPPALRKAMVRGVVKRFMVFSMPVVYFCNASVASANALAIWKNNFALPK